uniref:Probable G-protein coupled receptor 52 n=1 Tax=Cacopsylla melanoneura TaxID=428564 RepID=A0A8D8YP76_9HEMI
MEDGFLDPVSEASIIFAMAVAIIILNVLIIATIINMRGPGEMINYYILSLATADLLFGLLVVPLSVYPALAQDWVYGSVICRVVGYIEVTLWVICNYTFMWMSVDRYLAVRKPLRYETVQTKTRCQCWMAFTWISSAMVCCPPLLDFSEPKYDEDSYICMLDWGGMAAYTITLGFLVLGPSLITIVYTYSYIFSMMRKIKTGPPLHDKEYATALAENLSNPSHNMSFSLIMTFWLSWLPYIVVKLYEYLSGHIISFIPQLHFLVVWLGILNSVWKGIVLILMSPQFRIMLRLLCISVCCKQKSNWDVELIGMDSDD